MKPLVVMILACLFLAIASLSTGCHHQAAPLAQTAPSRNVAAQTPPIPPNAPPSEAQFLQNNSMPAAEKEAMIKQMQKQAGGAH